MQPQEQPVLKIGQAEIRYLIDGTVTGGGMGMFEADSAAGRAGPAGPQPSRQRGDRLRPRRRAALYGR